MAEIVACADGKTNVVAGTTTVATTDAITGVQYPSGTTVYTVRCATSPPTLINTNTIEQVAHPVLDASDYSILSVGVVLALVTAYGFKVVRKVL